MKTPFKLDGIYARKINPEKEFSNYKPTKLGSIWKAAIGEKDNPSYEIIWFSEIYTFSDDESEEKKYCADYSYMNGEIFGIADWQKDRGFTWAKYKNVFFDENKFEFGNEELSFSGSFIDDILRLRITNRNTGEFYSERFRYVPWI